MDIGEKHSYKVGSIAVEILVFLHQGLKELYNPLNQYLMRYIVFKKLADRHDCLRLKKSGNRCYSMFSFFT